MKRVCLFFFSFYNLDFPACSELLRWTAAEPNSATQACEAALAVVPSAVISVVSLCPFPCVSADAGCEGPDVTLRRNRSAELPRSPRGTSRATVLPGFHSARGPGRGQQVPKGKAGAGWPVGRVPGVSPTHMHFLQLSPHFSLSSTSRCSSYDFFWKKVFLKSLRTWTAPFV